VADSSSGTSFRKCSNNTNQTWTGANRVTIIFSCKCKSTKHLLLLFYKNILTICKKTRNTLDFIYTMEECTRNPSIH
jgi:hypothetical protein